MNKNFSGDLHLFKTQILSLVLPLPDHYENALQTIPQDVVDLEAKATSHLKKMRFKV